MICKFHIHFFQPNYETYPFLLNKNKISTNVTLKAFNYVM